MSTYHSDAAASNKEHVTRITSKWVRFTDDGRSDQWSQNPLFDVPSLEEVIRRGDRDVKAQAKELGIPYTLPVTVNRMPSIVKQTLLVLKTEMPATRTMSSASRFAVRTGLALIRNLEAVGLLRSFFRWAFYSGQPIHLEQFVAIGYDGFQTIGGAIVTAKLHAFYPDHEELTDMSTALGLPLSILALAAVIAGLAQVETDVVPERYVNSYARTIMDFARHLEVRAEQLGPWMK